ncbi:MAG TPA: FG-GAP repeat protein, partial [Polyangiaceae bacterium]
MNSTFGKGHSNMRGWLAWVGMAVGLPLIAASCSGKQSSSTASMGGPDASAGVDQAAALRMAMLRERQVAPGYEFAEAAAGSLHSRGGALDVSTEADGVHVAVPANAELSLSVATTSVGRADGSPGSQRVLGRHAEGQELVLTRERGVEERFLSGPLGVEQSFTLAEPPEGTGAIAIRVGFDGLLPELVPGATDRVALKDARGHQRAWYTDLVAVDASGRALKASMAVVGREVTLTVNDEGANYPVRVDPLVWTLESEVSSSDGAASDWFGWSVAINGSLAVIGAPSHAVSSKAAAGAAYVFARSGSAWSQQAELTASDATAGDAFGTSVALNGTLAVIGAPSHAVSSKSGAGAAYVFTQSGTTWTQQKELTAGDTAASDGFGQSVAVSGTLALVGAPSHNPASKVQGGTAYVFVQSGTSWSQQAEITAGDEAAFDLFGWSVALDGTTAVVGAYQHDVTSSLTSAGAVYVFTQSGTTWSQQQELKAGDAAVSDFFGYSVAVSGTLALVGAVQHNASSSVTSSGAAYVFSQSGTTWSQQQELTASDAAASDLFGYSVGINAGTAIVGAYQHTVGSNAAQGAAYTFTQSGTTWTQQQELTASDGAANDQYGIAVGTYQDYVVVGAIEHTLSGHAQQGEAYFYGGAYTGTADCYINGTLVASGATEPSNACMVCTPTSSTSGWSSATNGASCGTGQVCVSGACVSDCYISGTAYSANTIDPSNACLVCTPTTSTSTWSNVTAGTSCGSAKICVNGSCLGDCYIGGIAYGAGADPSNACLTCTPGISTSAWQNVTTGTSCGAGQICVSGSCLSDCDISGSTYSSGTPNPTNSCQVCTPTSSTTAWSSASTGTSCGTGQICVSGSCLSDCDISGSTYSSGTPNPANACQVCTPASSTTAWSSVSTGTSCGTGQICVSGSCLSDCDISGSTYSSGTPNPANACQVCTPTSSTTAWSSVSTGTSCGTGQICVSGSCLSDCDIGGSTYSSGTPNPANACQVCTPASSTT